MNFTRGIKSYKLKQLFSVLVSSKLIDNLTQAPYCKNIRPAPANPPYCPVTCSSYFYVGYNGTISHLISFVNHGLPSCNLQRNNFSGSMVNWLFAWMFGSRIPGNLRPAVR